MALDVGERRIGIALSDPTRTLAAPLTTIRAEPRAAALKRIATLIREHEVTALVIGLPLTMSGNVGPQATLVQQFADELRQMIEIPLYFIDERLTTAAAERMMLELNLKPEQRKARIDEVAASIILQDFLDVSRQTSG
ncbi:MAG: Holliday junction resolvase RuvX [Roseiflexus sp.]|nr:Holliday junction resolvase RuvX [Roseiflexus sp.]MCS7288499.1 Holliday junction resolvase RuvX [Roseiflexus sp.]MDW8231344.1 Holliday junction resolvase RuvX [Roseiflexaceae bacterium]